MKLVRIIYSSISGNTELVCQKIVEILKDNGLSVSLENCQVADLKHLLDCDILVFACPTYAHGELQVYFEQFLGKIPDLDCDQKPVAVVGLGDPKYDDDFNVESAVILSDWFAKHNGNEIIESLKINKSPVPQLDEKVKIWAEELIKKIS